MNKIKEVREVAGPAGPPGPTINIRKFFEDETYRKTNRDSSWRWNRQKRQWEKKDFIEDMESEVFEI